MTGRCVVAEQQGSQALPETDGAFLELVEGSGPHGSCQVRSSSVAQVGPHPQAEVGTGAAGKLPGPCGERRTQAEPLLHPHTLLFLTTHLGQGPRPVQDSPGAAPPRLQNLPKSQGWTCPREVSLTCRAGVKGRTSRGVTWSPRHATGHTQVNRGEVYLGSHLGEVSVPSQQLEGSAAWQRGLADRKQSPGSRGSEMKASRP